MIMRIVCEAKDVEHNLSDIVSNYVAAVAAAAAAAVVVYDSIMDFYHAFRIQHKTDPYLLS